MLSALFFITLFLLPPPLSTARSHHNRRILHQPLFPLDQPLPPTPLPLSTPQLQPSPSPQPSQQHQPKYPFSSQAPPTSTTTPPQSQNPFFPLYPSPPPPPTPPSASSFATFPANISSLSLPQSPSSSKPISRKLVAVIVSVSLFSAALIAALAAFLLHHKQKHHQLINKHRPRTDSLRLFPADTTPSKKPPPPPAPQLREQSATSSSSEFLYLGTLVSSREVEERSNISVNSNENNGSYERLNSPELRPLPPLPPRQHKIEEDEEEFFSPRSSSGDNKEIPCSPYLARDAKNPQKSYLYSNSNSPTHSSSSSSSSGPSVVLNSSSPISLTSKSPDSLVNFPAPPRCIPPLKPLSPPSSSEYTQNSPSRASDFSVQNLESPVRRHWILGPPPPPPPPQLVVPSRRKAEEESLSMKPKLKPLHWDNVRASSDRAMVWDQFKASSFQVNEEMIEKLFMVNSSNTNPKDGNWRPIPPGSYHQDRVLDPKKSQNIAILLRALNVTAEEVCEALSEGNTDSLGTELLESLMKMSPTKEEEQKLLEFKDDSPLKLDPAEKFLKAVLDIPFAFKRIDAMLYISNFDSEVEHLKRSFETLEAASKELRNSRMFLKLLEAVLKTGNRMNVGTNRGDAHAFKLDTLLKLVDVKGTDGKTTLLHFVVHVIIRAEGSRLSGAADENPNSEKNQQFALGDEVEFRKIGLQVVSGLGGELSNVRKAAAMDSDVLRSEVSKLATGITKITDVLMLNEELVLKEESNRKFSQAMNEFLRKAKEEIINIQVQEGLALSMVKEITEYFHGDSAKEEAHPFRIFMVVRDFLSILDQVCKDVGKINERTIISSGRQIPFPVNPSLPQVFPGVLYSSTDDDSSSSSHS